MILFADLIAIERRNSDRHERIQYSLGMVHICSIQIPGTKKLARQGKVRIGNTINDYYIELNT